jgi:hypothetical protein
MRIPYILLLIAIFLIGSVHAASELNYSNLAELQKAEGNLSKWLINTGHADILNASADIAPKISTGAYESTKYEIPIGPYKASFELRSPLSYFGVKYYPYNESVGEGKEYHTAQYDVYSMASGNVTNVTIIDVTTSFDGTGNSTTVKNAPDEIVPEVTFGFNIYIIHYKEPAKYQATYPYELLDRIYKIPRTWDDGSPTDITIDGKKGVTWNDIKWSKTDRILAERYTYRYDLDQDTFVVITTSGRWNVDKDLSLFEETLHIAKN